MKIFIVIDNSLCDCGAPLGSLVEVCRTREEAEEVCAEYSACPLWEFDIEEMEV